MHAYPDASFLFSLYIKQAHSAAVQAHLAKMQEPLHVGSLLRYEVSNAIRRAALQKSVSGQTALTALASFAADIEAGRVVIAQCPWERVHAEAERLSNIYTLRHGYSSFDILHVATALTLGAKEFLSFDAHQRKLAAAEGLKVKGVLP